MAIAKNRSSNRRRGFTLVELMVVIVIIAVLAALLFPAFSSMRENANVTLCKNNLGQIQKAVFSYEAAFNRYPSSWNGTPAATGSSDIGGWSAQAIILPRLEQGKLYDNIDFTQSYSSAVTLTTADGTNARLGSMRVPTYLCPSEVRDEPRLDSSNVPEYYPINYGFNLGTWFVYDPESGNGGDGAFYPNSRLSSSALRDGANETLCAAEVKGWNPYYRNGAMATDPGIPDPTNPSAICGLDNDAFKQNSGHTEWIDGRAHQTGFTTTFAPNTKVICTENGTEYDVDWTNWQEGKGLAAASPTSTQTFAAITARSYHPGGVNVVMMGGAVYTVADDINPLVWRAYSTRNGEEIIGNEDQLGR